MKKNRFLFFLGSFIVCVIVYNMNSFYFSRVNANRSEFKIIAAETKNKNIK